MFIWFTFFLLVLQGRNHHLYQIFKLSASHISGNTHKSSNESGAKILFTLSPVDIYYFITLRTGSRVLCMLGNCSTTQPHPPVLDDNRKTSTNMAAHNGMKINETFCDHSCGNIYMFNSVLLKNTCARLTISKQWLQVWNADV